MDSKCSSSLYPPQRSQSYGTKYSILHIRNLCNKMFPKSVCKEKLTKVQYINWCHLAVLYTVCYWSTSVHQHIVYVWNSIQSPIIFCCLCIWEGISHYFRQQKVLDWLFPKCSITGNEHEAFGHSVKCSAMGYRICRSCICSFTYLQMQKGLLYPFPTLWRWGQLCHPYLEKFWAWWRPNTSVHSFCWAQNEACFLGAGKLDRTVN